MALATEQKDFPSWLPEPLRPIVMIPDQITAWSQKQHPAVEVALATFSGSTQGAVLGGIMGAVSQMDPEAANPDPSKPPNPLNQGGPLVMARNFAVITGVQAGLSLAIKKYRGKDDVQSAMLSSLGAGVAFSLVANMAPPGSNPIVSAAATGMSFAVFSGAFYKLGEFIGGKKKNPEEKAAEDLQYTRGKAMLASLGYANYEKNLKQGLLTDSTILLWNNSALQEVKIPPGPRLIILDHIDTYRGALKDILKPAVPPPKPVFRNTPNLAPPPPDARRGAGQQYLAQK